MQIDLICHYETNFTFGSRAGHARNRSDVQRKRSFWLASRKPILDTSATTITLAAHREQFRVLAAVTKV